MLYHSYARNSSLHNNNKQYAEEGETKSRNPNRTPCARGKMIELVIAPDLGRAPEPRLDDIDGNIDRNISCCRNLRLRRKLKGSPARSLGFSYLDRDTCQASRSVGRGGSLGNVRMSGWRKGEQALASETLPLNKDCASWNPHTPHPIPSCPFRVTNSLSCSSYPHSPFPCPYLSHAALLTTSQLSRSKPQSAKARDKDRHAQPPRALFPHCTEPYNGSAAAKALAQQTHAFRDRTRARNAGVCFLASLASGFEPLRSFPQELFRTLTFRCFSMVSDFEG